MASKKKQRGMVSHQEGAPAPAAAPAGDHPPTRFVAPKPGKASEGGMERSPGVTSDEADAKPTMYPSKEASRTAGGLQSDNLSPDSICKGIRVTLDNNSMWNDFFRSKTEMILTKQGSRMFPYCRFRISGLQPSRKYSLIMDIQPLDNSRYKWTGKSWQVAGKAECHVKSQPFAHPESPSMGRHWMQSPVSFYKLKLTNDTADQEGNTILHPMHRYLPRLHVVQTDKAAKDIKLTGPSVVTFTFPQTEFMAVTAYQNSRFAQLKVDYNPFSKGLKEDGSTSRGLKLNSSKDSHKDGGTTTNEQHPFKKSLKSLLANYKPRSSKPADSKPSTSGDLQKNSTTNKDQLAAKATEECPCTSRPTQKLFSELIREAHVSLQRCNLEQLGINNSSSHRTERTNTKTTASTGNRQDVSKREHTSVKTQSETSSAKKYEAVGTKRKVKKVKDLLNSPNCKDNDRTDCSEVSNVAAVPAVSQNSSVDADHQCMPEAQPVVRVKPHKRPAPLPLPALALFLKQHSTKSKKAKSKPDSPAPALPSESPSESQGSAAAPECPPSDHSGSETGPSKESDNSASRRTGAHLHLDVNVAAEAGETAHQPSSPCPDAAAKTDPNRPRTDTDTDPNRPRTDTDPNRTRTDTDPNRQVTDTDTDPDRRRTDTDPDRTRTDTDPNGPRTDDFLTSISVAESAGQHPAVPDGTPVLPNSEQPFCTLGTSLSTISSTLPTSSPSRVLSPPLDTVLPAPNSPQTPTVTESSTLPPDSPTEKSDSLLPDPECSSFVFEPLSPASSPEPLPSLPALLTLQLESTTSDPTPKEELGQNENSAPSVFKWHTVLPPADPYVDAPFTTFQSAAQTLPLESVTSPLLPSQTHSNPEQQTFDTSTSAPPPDPDPDPAPAFQDNEQSLPFPAELSPLALQLPLSPTFSLNGDGLSPTPSLADLVQFFSTNDDLGMGVDFSNTEAVAAPCPPPNTAETNAHEVSQQVQPVPASKLGRHKKSRQRKLAKTDLDQKMDDSAYTSMQPKLEEVEEQLFISFTSKEALKLHVVDSSEETQPRMTPEDHLQRTTVTPENVSTDEVVDVGGSSLPDGLSPQNFPAKLWRMVNNPATKAISWDSRGEVVLIDQHLFERQILSASSTTSDTADAFKTTNFSSFVRQLHLYGFRKAEPACKDKHRPAGDSGTCYRFYNPNFKRSHPELVPSLRRLTVNNKAKIQTGLTVNCRSQHKRLSEDEDGGHDEDKTETLQETIAAFEKVLLRDLRLMRHRQVIHPVLQEVGLKMNLLDSSLAIDLQYLGVSLPLPPPGVCVEPPPPQGVCAAFVSRTGKTTDMTQIKGWRQKFSPSEAPPTVALPNPEAGPGPDSSPSPSPGPGPVPGPGPAPDVVQKKNLSAFCSDMLDQYLESEGKLIDQRASSFSQTLLEPPVYEPVYELPTRSSSYVRTLDSVLKKQPGPALDLISGFVPPSKRPKLSLKETRTSRRPRLPKPHRPRQEPAPADSNPVPTQPAVQGPDSLQNPTVRTRRRRLKPKTSSKTLSPHRSTAPPSGVSEDLAPLESDSELGTLLDQRDETSGMDGRPGPVMTRTLLRQKDLEDGAVWEGKTRTSITEERAAIALTSLFTLQGFVRENPTAPIQLVRRCAPPCLNEFCRLGCVCSSLSHCSRISHCGRPPCMFRCSCLKQKVVLLKNLDGSDSSPSQLANNRKKRRRRRMKMAYILKEADNVSQPAERVRTLWKTDTGDSDPDPVHVPEPAPLSRTSRSDDHSSCARVRGFKQTKTQKIQRDKQKKETLNDVKTSKRLKHLKHRDLTLKDTKTKPFCPLAVGNPVSQPPSSSSTRPPSPPSEAVGPKPSKRLIILAECKWVVEADRNQVLKELCERMAWDQLDEPFWIKNYLISPMGQTVEGTGTGSDHCIQYKIHISTPKLEPDRPVRPVRPEKPVKVKPEKQVKVKPEKQVKVKPEKPVKVKPVKPEKPVRPAQPGRRKRRKQSETPGFEQEHLKQVSRGAEPPEDYLREVKEEAEPLEAWQREVEEEEAGPLEDWQREVEDDDMDEEEAAVSTADQVHDRTESIKEEVRIPQKKKKKKMVRMALPFLTGISPAGFLSANKKQPGGTDQLIQVNKKLYPLAKIQLGKMGALHPANRLAAYLTGRVGSNRKQQAASSSLSTDRPQNQNRSSGLPPVPVSGPTVAPPRSQPAVTLLALPTPPTVVQPPPVKVVQSAASSDPPAGSRVVTVMVYPQAPTGGANQIRVLPAASGSSAPTKASQVVSPVAPPPKASQLLLLHVPPPPGKVPVAAPPPLSSSSSSSLGQRVLLQPVPSSSPSGQRVVAPPPSSSGQRVVAPPPSSPGQRVLLQPVQTASGLQYFRKPDGKLVQLVPISQLKSLNQNQNQAVHRGSLSPSVVPPASRQTPVVTVLNQTPPMTSLSSSSSLSSSFSSSSSPLRPPSGTCTFKLLPSGSSKDPIIITCPKVPSRPPTRLLTAPTSLTLLKPVPPSLPSSSPLNLISLKPSVGQGAELGVKTLTVSPGGLLVHQTPATTPPHRPKSPAPPPADESPTEPEPARDLVDLDIVCVDDETGLVVEETVGREAQSLDVAEREASASSETENSSDFGDETESEGETKTDVSVKTNRLLHNVLEKRRRLKLQRLFEALGREVGLSDEKTSKIRTLRTAVQVIEQLRTTETNLQEKKRRLTKTRDDFLSIIAPTGKSSRCLRSPDRGQTGRPMDAVDLLDETDELTENSSDEDRLVTTTTDVSTVTNEDEVQCVDVETLEDSGRLDAAQRTNVDSESSLSVAAQSVTAAFRALRSVLNAEDAPETLLLHRAREEIETLQRETDRLMSLKTKLNQQRDIFIRDVSQRSGKSEQVILRKLHHLSSKQRQMERRHGAANQLPAAAGDGASHPPAGDTTDDEVIITSFKLNTQAPPTPVPAPPTSTPAAPPTSTPSAPHTSIPVHPPAPPAVPTGVPTAVHQAQTHRVLQVSHGASEHRDRPKTVPNILSRRKTPALPASSLESPSFQALLPAEVLSLVSTPSPGQQVMTLSPLMAAPTVLQTSSSPGVASVTLNIPSLTNQQIHLTSLPRPPTATNFTNLLQLLHTSPQQQTPAPQQQDPPCTSVVSAGSDISSDPIRDQTTPESCSLTPPPASGQSSDVTERESLSSLLDEIVFLNQQPVTTATPPSPGEEPDDAHSPWLLQLDSDSDDTVTMETDEAGLNDYAETAEAETQPGPANGITTGCSVVAPPPLLQMKAGGAKVADPGDSGGASGGGGAGGGGGAWRPMPRLVPLGLRGAPPS